MNRYEFKVTLLGYGGTPEEAWRDAIETFYDDPGLYDDGEWEQVEVGTIDTAIYPNGLPNVIEAGETISIKVIN